MSEALLSACCRAEAIGQVVQGVYDGVLFWTCSNCGWAWNRWHDRSQSRTLVAQEYVDRWNEER